jgi:hypothetical protein
MPRLIASKLSSMTVLVLTGVGKVASAGLDLIITSQKRTP